MRRSSSTLISHWRNFSNSKDVIWTGLEHAPSFAFSVTRRFSGRWRVALGEGRFWLPPHLRAGGNVKAAAKRLSSLLMWVLKASQNCSPGLNFYCTCFTCFVPKRWELDRRVGTENTCPCVTWCFQLCRRWKLWEARPTATEQGSRQFGLERSGKNKTYHSTSSSFELWLLAVWVCML